MSGLNPMADTKPSADLTNFNAAHGALKMTPQEQALYMRHLANVTGPGGVDNPDGTRSTLFQMTFERDGKAYVIPTVWGGKIVPPEEAIKLADKEGLDKFPSYPSSDEAEARYDALHKYMEKDIPSTDARAEAAFGEGFNGAAK